MCQPERIQRTRENVEFISIQTDIKMDDIFFWGWNELLAISMVSKIFVRWITFTQFIFFTFEKKYNFFPSTFETTIFFKKNINRKNCDNAWELNKVLKSMLNILLPSEGSLAYIFAKSHSF